jgi:hypothetical protein
MEGEAMKRMVFIVLTLAATVALSGPMTSSSLANNTTTCKAFASREAYCNAPLTAGVRIESASGEGCTAGPLVLPTAVANRSETYVLTAGHCFDMEGESWFAKTTNGVKMEIGLSSKFIENDEADIGVIKIADPGAWALVTRPKLYAVMAKWGTLGKEFPSVPVLGEEPQILNNESCLEGAVSGEKCGKIILLKAPIKLQGLTEIEGLTIAGGDSGGPIFSAEHSDVMVEGIFVGRRPSTQNALSEPLIAGFVALTAKGLELELLTPANEGRQGPAWHRRTIGIKGEGSRIAETEPEEVAGEGGEQILRGKLSGAEVEISSKAVQAKGIIYNNAMQGQAKLGVIYQEPKLVKPTLPSCVVKIGKNNNASLFGHLAWSWNGEKKQLEETSQASQKPDWIFLPTEIEANAKELPKGTFVEIHFASVNCGLLSGLVLKVLGSLGATIKPEKVAEWGTTETTSSAGGKLVQHFWNGKEFVGVTTGLTSSAEAVEYKGEFKTKTIGHQGVSAQEVAHYEN